MSRELRDGPADGEDVSEPGLELVPVAGPAELDAILPRMSAYYAFEGLPFDREHARRALDMLLDDPGHGRPFVLRLGGEVIGYAVLAIGFSLEAGGREGWIDELWIDEAWRGRGLGRAAIARLVAEARSLGLAVLHLDVGEDNARALSLYLGAGFRPRTGFRTLSLALQVHVPTAASRRARALPLSEL